MSFFSHVDKKAHIFSLVWNQDLENNMMYVCKGPSFSSDKRLDIYAIPNVSNATQCRRDLKKIFNNAFPSTNLEGKYMFIIIGLCMKKLDL